MLLKRIVLVFSLMLISVQVQTVWSKSRGDSDSEKMDKKQTVEFTDKEQAFIVILLSDTKQNRKNITFDPILLQVARERAKDMAKRNYFSHTNPDGYGPNYLLKKAGYKLPEWWKNEKAANYIESISGGRSTAQETYTGWMNSPGHKKHVLGEIEFYSSQTVVAIGHYYDPNSEYKHYWVFLSAPSQD